MLKNLSHWIHHLFNPHCEQCREELEESRICHSCEAWKQQLAMVNAEKAQLLQALINTPAEVTSIRQEVDIKEIKPKIITWAVRKQMLEAEDRERARIMREQNIKDETKIDKELTLDIEELERKVGIIN